MTQAPDLPRVSPLLFAWFSRYAGRYLARHFHAVRLSRAGPPPAVPIDRPLVVYFNHPSWWDPLVCLKLATTFFPGRTHYGPIDAAALERYRFFGKLGFFGVEPGTARGARRFLATARGLLARPGATIWLTPAGRFTDPRERGVELRAGLGHLLRRDERTVALPLALEYPFWEERFPEALARFGEPLAAGGDLGDLDADGWTELLSSRLEALQDALAGEALRRDPAAFEVLVGGSAGVGGVYDAWRRALARLEGRRFRAEHGAVMSPLTPRPPLPSPSPRPGEGESGTEAEA